MSQRFDGVPAARALRIWRALASSLALAPRRLLVLVVRFYRFWLKPWLGSACRFEPTCSQYALDALARHGAAKGAALAGWRILRCHPYCNGGCDPVPERFPDLAAPARGLFSRLIQRP